MEKILVSACLLGRNVRYNGVVLPCTSEILARWQHEGRLVPVCPEVAGGLPIPRPAAEIVANRDGHNVLTHKGRVVNRAGDDVTAQFIAGALDALKTAQQHGVTLAILKENSPSCGSRAIYDGTFSGTRKAGQGVTAALLTQHGIHVVSEENLQAATDAVNSTEPISLLIYLLNQTRENIPTFKR
jgi:uncharacterized protein YbbK (DUF523 family)